MDLMLLYQTSDSECIIQSELLTRIKKIIESSLIGISKKDNSILDDCQVICDNTSFL